MDNKQAKKILVEMGTEISVNQLFNGDGNNFFHFLVNEEDTCCLDGDFTPNELEAIVTWARDPHGVTNAVLDNEEPK